MHGKLISPHNVRTDHTVLRSNLKIHQVWWYDWELHAEGHAMAKYSSRHWLQWPRTVTAFCTAFCIVILLRIAKFRLERVSSSVGFNCPQSARSDSWQWLAAKQHRHFTPCLSLTSSDHHIYKSYMHMGSCWQSQVSTSQHVLFLLFACPRAMYPADDLILVTHSLKCLRSSMVVSSITEGCLLASHIRTAVNTLIDLSFCCINSLRGLLMLYLRHFVTACATSHNPEFCLRNRPHDKAKTEWWIYHVMTHVHTRIVDEVWQGVLRLRYELQRRTQMSELNASPFYSGSCPCGKIWQVLPQQCVRLMSSLKNDRGN